MLKQSNIRRLNSSGEWKKSQQQNIKNEIETLKCLRHENIIRLLAYNLNAKYPDRTGKTRDVILLVLEYAAGGELFDILYYTEKLEPILARTYFRQLVAGIECMHKCGIIHRDIKPQNLLLDNKYNLKVKRFINYICENANKFLNRLQILVYQKLIQQVIVIFVSQIGMLVHVVIKHQKYYYVVKNIIKKLMCLQWV